jgi:hypothetical protein
MGQPSISLPKIMRLRPFIIFFALCVSAFASDIYFGQTSAGSNNGTSCANAYAYSDGTHGWNTAGAQTAGNILHVCGILSFGAAAATPLTLSHSGSSGNPITLKFETGSGLTANDFSTAAIGGSGISWWVIDGGTNGVIQNTLNGDTGAICQAGACTSHNGSSIGINLTNCTNCEIKNLTVNNIYIEVPGLAGGANSVAISFTQNSTGSKVHNNTIGSAKTSLLFSLDAGGDASNVQIYNNSISDQDWGIGGGGSGATESAQNVLIHDNDITNWSNWSQGHSTGCSSAYHQDGIIWFNYGGAPTATYNLAIYNNYIHGDLTDGCPTGFIYCADDLPCDVFNNVLQTTNSAANHNQFGIMWLGQGGGDPHPFAPYARVWNNTILSANAADVCAMFNLVTAGASDYRNNVCYGTGANFSNNIESYITTVTATAALFGNWDYNDWNPLLTTKFWGSQANGTNASWATWKGLITNGDAHSITSNPTLNSAPYATPQAGSPVIGAGVNLTSLCSGVDTPLCTGPPQTFGVNGSCGAGCIARPSSAAWDMGAFPFAAPATPPTFTTPASCPFTGPAPITVVLNDPNTGTHITCTKPNAIPATNNLGTGCASGSTPYAGSFTESSSMTLYAVSGTSTLADSSPVSCTLTVPGASSGATASGTWSGTLN